jgi:hypothetical protein
VDGAGLWKQTLGVAMRSTQARLTSSSSVTKFELTQSRLLLSDEVQLLYKQGIQHCTATFSSCSAGTDKALGLISVTLKAIQFSHNIGDMEDSFIMAIKLPDCGET